VLTGNSRSEYESLANEAAAFAQNMTFSFEGAKPAGDVVRFFEALRIDPQLRWDVFVSSEYLTLAFLVEDTKYTPHEAAIDSILRSEETDRRLIKGETNFQPTISVAGRRDITDIKDLVHALSSKNGQYKGVDLKGTLDRAVFGYGWAAERSHFYNAVAAREGANVYLAPLRDAFCESCCRIDYPSQVDALLDTLKSNSQQTMASILEPSGQAKFALRLPFFTAYLISKTDNPNQCIDLALSMRSNREFQECRTIFHNLDHLSASRKTEEINGILKYLDQSFTKLLKKYAVSTGNGAQFSLSLGLAGINIGASLKLDNLFRSYKNRSFARIFRNIAQDMLNIERLGGLYDKVCSSIIEHPDANHPRISTAPKFMEDKENEYGRPVDL